jgi:hypothetical protein
MTTLGAVAAIEHEFRVARAPKFLALVLIALFATLIIGWLLRRSQRREFIETFGVQVCRRCGANGPPHAMFCGKCGGRVKG